MYNIPIINDLKKILDFDKLASDNNRSCCQLDSQLEVLDWFKYFLTILIDGEILKKSDRAKELSSFLLMI